MKTKETLPNSTTVLVLGIISVTTFFIILGPIAGIIGIIMSTKGRELNSKNPDKYNGFQNLNAGFIMSIIGTALSVLIIIGIMIYFASQPDEIRW